MKSNLVESFNFKSIRTDADDKEAIEKMFLETNTHVPPCAQAKENGGCPHRKTIFTYGFYRGMAWILHKLKTTKLSKLSRSM